MRAVALLLAVVLSCGSALASLIGSQQCGIVGQNDFLLASFVQDVVIDEDTGMLQFFITSKVINRRNISDTGIQIQDVDIYTNRWSNLHVEIWFMGEKFIDENVRFCDIVSVKKTDEYYVSPRFRANATHAPTPEVPPLKWNESLPQVNQRRGDRNDALALNYTAAAALPSGHDAFVLNNTEMAALETVFDYANNTVHCPLYVNDTIVFRYEAPLDNKLHRLGSYTATFTLILNDANSTIVSCNKSYITPIQKASISRAILIGVLCLLLFTGVVNFVTIIYSSYQESSNPLLFTVSTICNESLLKQLECTVHSIVLYMQFALFIAALDLQYPGFYQPIISKFKWCALIGVINIFPKGPSYLGSKSRAVNDHVYNTFYKRGLSGLTAYSTNHASNDTWQNFMVVLCIWMAIMVVAKQLFLYVRRLVSILRGKRHMVTDGQLSSSKNLCLVFGDILNNFLDLFAMPFLILTLHLFSSAVDLHHKSRNVPYIPALKAELFDENTSYDELFQAAVPRYSLPADYDGYNQTIRGTPLSSNHTVLHGNFTSRSDRKDYVYRVPTKTLVPAALCLALWVGLVLYFVFNYLITITIRGVFAQNSNRSKLYTSLKTILLWGFLYYQYEPRRVLYVIVPYVTLALRSIVIAVVQNHGSAQVIILSVVEAAELALLIYYKPFYVKFSWYSTRFILAVARLVVTLLCIPFIDSLQVSEEKRTFVAYGQLAIHLFVSVTFLSRLIHGFVSMIISIVAKRSDTAFAEKMRLKKKVDSKRQLSLDNSIDDFNRDFEYQQDDNLMVPKHDHSRHSRGKDFGYYFRSGIEGLPPTGGWDDTTTSRFEKVGTFEMGDEFHEESSLNSYVRPARVFCRNDEFNESDARDPLLSPAISPDSSFHEQQMRSDKRKKMNDYTFREGDLIYKKYFVDQNPMDPEIKALWDSRNHRIHSFQEHSTVTTAEGKTPHILSKLSTFFPWKNNTPPQTGFEVSRPKQIVIKTGPLGAHDHKHKPASSHSDESFMAASTVSPQSSTDVLHFSPHP
ncbi:TRP C-terminal domain-containing protein [[Candida] zeylanoides]